MGVLATLVEAIAEVHATPEFWRAGIKAIAEGSAAMVSWSLAIAGGSIVTIVSTSYLRPPPKMRRVYLLFLPGWICLGVSIFFGDAISRGYLAAQVGQPQMLPEIVRTINTDYANQQQFLSYGLIAFGLWLVIFLFWWVFGDSQPASGGT